MMIPMALRTVALATKLHQMSQRMEILLSLRSSQTTKTRIQWKIFSDDKDKDAGSSWTGDDA